MRRYVRVYVHVCARTHFCICVIYKCEENAEDDYVRVIICLCVDMCDILYVWYILLCMCGICVMYKCGGNAEDDYVRVILCLCVCMCDTLYVWYNMLYMYDMCVMYKCEENVQVRRECRG